MRRSALSFAAGLAFVAAAALVTAPSHAGAQVRTAVTSLTPEPLPAETIKRSRLMLADMREELNKHYFDSTFRGIDMDARFKQADSAIVRAPTLNHAMAAIADYMGALNDSHTRFLPPSRVSTVDYGFDLKFYGDTCFVIRVKKDSDAKKSGLKRGDAILKIDNVALTRANFSTVQYVYYALSPRPGMRLVVRGTDGADRDLIVKSKVTEGDRVIDLESQTGVSRYLQQLDEQERIANHSFVTIRDSVLYWKMEEFQAEDEANLDRATALAQKHRAVILDLRGNGGGYITALQYVVGRFGSTSLDMFTDVERNRRSVVKSIPAGGKAYNGMLVVLIDSESGSSSEITARALQLDGRAIIVGDRSAGAVVAARQYPHSVGFGRRIYYVAYVSVADVIMADGNRLEGIGVKPDHVVIPSGIDLIDGGDVQLAKALSLVGVEVDKGEAAAIIKASKR